ncbi:MAG: hypothetical protein OEZ01_11830, partial [Candidatus Heimdallarchaeota archaeon]|nr:hypothetical protein [Candidatus Heimdallarchaeota archaeon]
DIESSESMKIPIKSLFLSSMILIPMLFMPMQIQSQTVIDDRVIWNGTFTLEKDLMHWEEVEITFPFQKEYIEIYVDTVNVSEFKAYDNFGVQLPVEVEEDRFRILNPTLTMSYEMYRPYTLYNYSNILVYLDRLWLEFLKEESQRTADDPYLYVDYDYNIVLPEGAILYSASPSDQFTKTINEQGRINVNFNGENQRMDAFHDVFETQVTFSYFNVLEALENLDSDFVQIREEQESIDSLIKVAATEILMLSILGLLAPLISFFIAYWVFRRRYLNKIKQAEEQQEERILVENVQIEALIKSIEKSAEDEIYKSFRGQYFKLINRISRLVNKDVLNLTTEQILNEVRRKKLDIDINTLQELIIFGNTFSSEDHIEYSELLNYSENIDVFLDELSRR